MDPLEIHDIRHSLSHDWGVEATPDEASDWDTLLDALIRRVDYLLAHDYERLLQGMYLLDVSEERFNEAMDPTGADIPPRAIAKLILKREIEKMQSRKRYAQTEPPTGEMRLDDQPRIESKEDS